MPANSFISHIKQQLLQFYEGGNWVTTGALKKLSALDPSITLKKQPGHSHSICELVLHITAWRKFVLARLQSDDAFDIEDNSESDWPTALSWENALASFKTTQDNLMETLTAMEGIALEQTVAGRTYSYAHMLQGMVHHDYYHYGQIGSLAASFK